MVVIIKSALCWGMTSLMSTDGYVGQPTQLCSVAYYLRHPAGIRHCFVTYPGRINSVKIHSNIILPVTPYCPKDFFPARCKNKILQEYLHFSSAAQNLPISYLLVLFLTFLKKSVKCEIPYYVVLCTLRLKTKYSPQNLFSQPFNVPLVSVFKTTENT